MGKGSSRLRVDPAKALGFGGPREQRVACCSQKWMVWVRWLEMRL